MAQFEADYLVIGTGATAMAFVDTLLDQQPTATVVMVDRHHRPGGHWNDAYPFVRLHTPAAWYGVASREMADGSRETAGMNAGMWRLATGPEILSYFDLIMGQRFMPSGRVRWLPRCEWQAGSNGVHRVRSLTTGEEHSIHVRRKLVNATLSRTEVPATHPPRYAVSEGVNCIQPNLLPHLKGPHDCYTVIGAGKTGMDVCLWLIENGVPHARIRWVMPRDPWVQDRANFQPGPQGYRRYLDGMIAQLGAIAAATRPVDVFHRLEEAGIWLRFDRQVEPTTYRCAIVSRAEFLHLQRIGELGNIVRLGHVRALTPASLVLAAGELAAATDTLYVDCSSAGLQPAPKLPVFDRETINLQMVRVCQLIFSASVIAWVESHVQDPLRQNAMCTPIPTPEAPLDLLRMWAGTLANVAQWRQTPELMAWMSSCRLNGQTAMLQGVEIGPEVKALLDAIALNAPPAAARARELLSVGPP